MSKKKLFSLAVVVIMIAILSFSTLAWFTDTDSVTNDFQISNSLDDFEVDVWEKVPDGPDGDGALDEVGRGESGTTPDQEYENVVPGVVYAKEVYVENTSNNNLTGQYIKLELTFTNYPALHAMIVDLSEATPPAAFDCTTMLRGVNFNADKGEDFQWWYDQSATRYDEVNNTVTYVFYLKEVLYDGEYRYLFTGVELPSTMDINDAAYLIETNGFQIKAVAYAIQSANIAKPNGTTEALDLEDVLYAFGTEWANQEAPAAPAFPDVTP